MIRELVRDVLDFKLVEGDWNSYCRLVDLVFRLRVNDLDCLYSTDYNYYELLLNLIDSAYDSSAFKPDKYLIDPDIESGSDWKDPNFSPVIYIQRISKELVGNGGCNICNVIMGLANLSISMGEDAKKPLLQAIKVAAEYHNDNIDSVDAKRKLVVIVTPVISEMGVRIERERDKLRKMLQDVDNVKYANKGYMRVIKEAIDSALKWGI